MSCETLIEENGIKKYSQVLEDYMKERKEVDFTDKIHEIDKEINLYKLKLQEYREKYEQIEMELYSTKQLQEKAVFILSNVQNKTKVAEEDLNVIDANYEACLIKTSCCGNSDQMGNTKIKTLKIEQNQLQQELKILNQNRSANIKKLAEVHKMIADQEKKNIASLEMLLHETKTTYISPELRERINTLNVSKIDKNSPAAKK